MNRHFRAAIFFTALSAGAGLASQTPEVLVCQDSEGNNRTEYTEGDIVVPHCDDEFMGETALSIHTTAKQMTLLFGGIAIGSAIAGKVYQLPSGRDRRHF